MAPQFTLFRQLPPELRLKIWEFAIPTNHVTELDAPYKSCRPHEAQCDMRNASRRNGASPAIGKVCREARRVVQENGCLLSQKLDPNQALDTFNKITGQFFWPHRDMVHLNWTLKYADAAMMDGESNPIPCLQACVQFAKGVSVTNELVFTKSFFDGLSLDLGGKPFLQRNWSQNLQLLGSFREIFVCLCRLNIHAPTQLVQDKNLFETPIQLVDPFDHDTMERMHNLWQEGLSTFGVDTGDGQSEIVFREILKRDTFRQRLDIWGADITNLWLHHRYTQSWTSIQGPKQLLWEPPADVENFDPVRINLAGHSWNQGHPWVKAELDAMPNFRPVVMFRHCTKNCLDMTPFLRPPLPGFPPMMGPRLHIAPFPDFFDHVPRGV